MARRYQPGLDHGGVPQMTTAVTQLVDQMLDAAAQAHLGVEYTIMLAQENSLLLQREAERLYRTVNGRFGYYAGDV